MCGIAGVVQFDGAPLGSALVERMCTALYHRGPDEGAVTCLPRDPSQPRGHDTRSAAAVLGNRRLSIIDVAGGQQPIGNEDGTIWTTLNGEIYNFMELRQSLIACGHRFATRSDTEVLVHAYEQWGEAFVERLDGMFAFAIWDRRAERLLLARDRFGKKPLVYRDDDNRLTFASELAALVTALPDSRALDVDALATYLAYMAIPAPRTIYAGIRKLPPAHVLVRDRSGTHLRCYWSLEFEPKTAVREDAAVERIRDLLAAAVRKRLVSEVPLGAFLSGGVDSSAVVACMAEALDAPVKTFSIGFDDPEYDELPYARRVAAMFGCDHHEFVVRPSAFEILPGLIEHFGEPYADSSAIPSWYLAKMTRQHVTVALNGDGGDELFGGYGRHLANDLAEHWRRVPDPLRRSAERVARARVLNNRGGARIARFASAAGLSRAERYRSWAGVFSDDAIAQLSNNLPVEPVVPREFDRVSGLDGVDAILAVDTRFYLPTDLLPKVDITSMAHSLEVRSPLLDVPLAEFVATLPSTLKVHRLTTKYLLKRAMAGRLPPTTLKRAKRGFAVPIGRWLRGDLRTFLSDHLQPSSAATAGLLRQAGIDRVIGEHVSGAIDHAHQLWTLLMLELWHRRFAAA